MKLPHLHKMLFVAPIGGMVTGQSNACLHALAAFKEHFNVILVDTCKVTNATVFFHILSVCKALIQVVWKCPSSDVVYFNLSESFLGLLKDIIFINIFRINNKSYVCHLHGGNNLVAICKNRKLLRSLLIQTYGGAASFIVVGQHFKRAFLELGFQDNIFVLENFCSDDFIFSDEDINKKLNDTNIQRPINIVFISNFFEGKGFNELLEACVMLKAQDDTPFTLHLAGAFPSIGKKKAFLAKASALLGDNVVYYGILEGSAKRDLFFNADIFCLPTYYSYEGQPISILEALAAGCYVVTTDHAGICDIFENKVNGAFVLKADVFSLYGALRLASSDVEMLRRAGRANVDKARSRFFRERYIRSLCSLMLRSVLS